MPAGYRRGPFFVNVSLVVLCTIMWFGFTWTLGTPYLRSYHQSYQLGSQRISVNATYWHFGKSFRASAYEFETGTCPLIILKAPDEPFANRVGRYWNAAKDQAATIDWRWQR